MSSKMREALREAMGFAWREGYACRVSRINQENWSCEPALSEIAQRYGDLEFTREEVRGMLCDAAQQGRFISDQIYDDPEEAIANEILSRHLGEGESEVPKQWAKVESEHGITNVALLADVDDTPTIKASEIARITGEKVPEWARWITTDFDGLTILSQYHPEQMGSAGGIRWVAGGSSAPVKGFSIPGPWQDSLRRIIHDEPDKWEINENTEGVEVHPGHSLDREVGELHGELIVLTKRVAAIEKRLLADGHHKRCKWALAANFYERADVEAECTCGHDDVKRGQ